jgi:CBS domain-containing protein
VDRGAGASRGGFQQGQRGERDRNEWGSWGARGGMGAQGTPELESGYRESGIGGRERQGERHGRGAEMSGQRSWHDEQTEQRLRSSGEYYERDASADLGLGYRDFGEGRARTTADEPRRTRWHREPTAARDVMTRNPKSVARDAGVHEIARIMREESTGVVPVVDENGMLAGLVTDRDIVMRALAEGRNPLDLRATDVMTDDVEAVTPDESLREVVELMGERQIRRVPVVDRNDRLVGIISMADVATRADFDEDLQDALEEISARRSFWSRLFG